jgi:hypothetical protein
VLGGSCVYRGRLGDCRRRAPDLSPVRRTVYAERRAKRVCSSVMLAACIYA